MASLAQNQIKFEKRQYNILLFFKSGGWAAIRQHSCRILYYVWESVRPNSWCTRAVTESGGSRSAYRLHAWIKMHLYRQLYVTITCFKHSYRDGSFWACYGDELFHFVLHLVIPATKGTKCFMYIYNINLSLAKAPRFYIVQFATIFGLAPLRISNPHPRTINF